MTTQTSCSGCNRPIADTEVLFSPEGAPVCATCFSAGDIRVMEQRASAHASHLAWATLALALLSIVANPFFVVTVASLGSGFYTIRSIKLDPKAKGGALLALAWVGIGLALLRASAIFWLPFVLMRAN